MEVEVHRRKLTPATPADSDLALDTHSVIDLRVVQTLLDYLTEMIRINHSMYQQGTVAGCDTLDLMNLRI
eukprot:120530-Amorphochlora_amoeboformis.AAC.1